MEDYFSNPNEFSDVKISLKTCQMTFYANKAILSEASPIIKTFLAIQPSSTLFIDEDDNQQSRITSNDIVNLLKFIYPQFHIKLSEENILGLIHLSEKYLIEILRNQCKNYVHSYFNHLELIDISEKKDFRPKYILYKDGTRKHISSELNNLCGFYREYSTRDENLSLVILNVLKHASVDDLEQNETFVSLSDREKTEIYKHISEYLEQQSYLLEN